MQPRRIVGSIARMQRPPRRTIAALCLGALVIAGCTSGGGAGSSAAPGPGPAVVDLRVSQARVWAPVGLTWAITLSWQPPPATAVDHYELRRDGIPLGGALTTTSYRDADVDPATSYTYQVVTIPSNGVPSQPAVLKVRTNAPPLEEARLGGSFLVRMRVTSSKGLAADPSSGSLMFRYDPRCAAGPCSVHWSVRGRGPRASLTRDGARYAGSGRGAFLIRSCKGGTIPERLQLTTRVVAGGPIHRTWRATRIEGTLRETGHANGCARASIAWTFRGVIQT